MDSSYPDKRDVRTSCGLAILNRYGGIWSDQLFKTPEEAMEHLRAYWKDREMDPTAFRLAIATQTISLDRKVSEPTYIPWPRS